MKIRRILTNIALVMGIISFTQCATSQKMETSLPSEIKNPYFQNWNEDDSSGFTILCMSGNILLLNSKMI